MGRKLFFLWCIATAIWLCIGIFGGDGAIILKKFQVGGWRAAYVHVGLTILIAVIAPATVLALGWLTLRVAGRLGAKSN